MTRSAWAPATLVLLLGACVPDVDIARDTTLGGHLKTKSFHVAPGATVSADRDLVIESQGPVTIEGSVRGALGSGASIEIRVSTGDCVVEGGLEAGPGADGEEPGEDGAPGGSVRLRADQGEVRVRGALAAGAGGDGAGRREQGRGDLRVVSGAGGAGGDVVILGASVVLGASASAGDGGAGGSAFARVAELAPGAANLVDGGVFPVGEETEGFGGQPLPSAGSARAVSRPGGNGGSIMISASGRRGISLAPGVPLRAGDGGATARASSYGGKEASAALEKPGAGGDVSLRGGVLTAAATGWILIPGEGGDAGSLGAVSGAARAHEAAGARTAGGGEAGKALVEGARVASGDGGDGGDVLAQSDAEAKYDFGGPGTQAPGKPAAAQAP